MFPLMRWWLNVSAGKTEKMLQSNSLHLFLFPLLCERNGDRKYCLDNLWWSLISCYTGRMPQKDGFIVQPATWITFMSHNTTAPLQIALLPMRICCHIQAPEQRHWGGDLWSGQAFKWLFENSVKLFKLQFVMSGFSVKWEIMFFLGSYGDGSELPFLSDSPSTSVLYSHKATWKRWRMVKVDFWFLVWVKFQKCLTIHIP